MAEAKEPDAAARGLVYGSGGGGSGGDGGAGGGGGGGKAVVAKEKGVGWSSERKRVSCTTMGICTSRMPQKR